MTVALASLALLLPDPASADMSAEGSAVPGTNISALTSPNDEWATKNQRRSWWNSYARRWDAVLPVGSGSDWWIATGVTGSPRFVAEVDSSAWARPDVYWEEADRVLYILRTGTQTLLNAYAYDPPSDSYGPILVAVPVPGIGPHAALHRTPNGFLWASVIGGNALWVNRSADGGLTWGSAVKLSPVNAGGQTGIEDATSGAQTSVVVVAAEDGGFADSRYRAFSIDQNAPGWGNSGNWTNESGRLPPFEGAEHADDEMSVTGDLAGNLYAVTETEPGSGSRSRGDPHVVLFSRAPGGAWSKIVVQRFGAIPDDRKRPTVVVDESNADLYVFSTSQSREENSFVRAPLSNLALLATNPPVRVFSAPGKEFRNNFVPRSVLCAESGLLVLIDNLTDGTIWQATVQLPAAPCAVPAAGLTSASGIVPGGAGSPGAGRAATATSLHVRRMAKRIRAFGVLTPAHPGARMRVTLRVRRPDGSFGRFVTRPAIGDTGRYAAWFKRPPRGRCSLTAVFLGDADHDRSSWRRSMPCRRPAVRR